MSGPTLSQIMRHEGIETVETGVLLDILRVGMDCMTRFSILKRTYSVTSHRVDVDSLPMPMSETVAATSLASVCSDREHTMRHYSEATCVEDDLHLLGLSLAAEHYVGERSLLSISDPDHAHAAAHHMLLHVIENMSDTFDLALDDERQQRTLAMMLCLAD